MSSRPELVQFANLTPDHFTRHPIWVQVHTLDYDEPWYDEADEETFRPWTGSLPVNPGEAMFLVRARFTLADGSVLPGFLTPHDTASGPDLGTVQPQIFTQSGHRHAFWDGMFPRGDQARAAFYRDIGRDARAVFPIQFDAESGLSRGTQRGSVDGFYSQPSLDGPVRVAK